jgi:zinc protease
LSSTLHNDNDLHSLDSYEADMASVKTGGLKAMANKYLSGKNYIRLVLLPEK